MNFYSRCIKIVLAILKPRFLWLMLLYLPQTITNSGKTPLRKFLCLKVWLGHFSNGIEYIHSNPGTSYKNFFSNFFPFS